jgi:hypothetical protein
MRSLSRALGTFRRSDDKAAAAFRLVRLYRDWDRVVGPDIAALVRPLGRRKRTLVVGAEDTLAVQEAHYAAPEILERVHAHLGEECFDKVKVDLLMGKTPLDTSKVPQAARAKYPLPPRPGTLGGLDLDPESAVGRSYAAYLRLYGE